MQHPTQNPPLQEKEVEENQKSTAYFDPVKKQVWQKKDFQNNGRNMVAGGQVITNRTEYIWSTLVTYILHNLAHIKADT